MAEPGASAPNIIWIITLLKLCSMAALTLLQKHIHQRNLAELPERQATLLMEN